jgi:uncharacterized protein YdeI (YjbR/CyaY-like superfamily)
MAPTVIDPAAIRAFPDPVSFAEWLAAEHETAGELWLRLYKKQSGVPTISYAEALDIALCWGWIDGQKKPFDDESFLQRFCPRGRNSIWSQRNVAHAERLIAQGRMQPAGQAQIDAAKADGRWQRAYAAGRDMEIPPDLRAAIAADPAAEATFATLNRQNLYSLAFRTHNMKTPAGRAKKIASLVAMLARGQTPHPNGAGKGKGRETDA